MIPTVCIEPFAGGWILKKKREILKEDQRLDFNEDHRQLSFHLIRGHIVASILLCPGRGYYYYQEQLWLLLLCIQWHVEDRRIRENVLHNKTY